METGETYRAVTEFQRVLHHFGDDAPLRRRALAGLARAYARAGRWDEAAGAREALFREDPSPEARLALGAALYRAGRNAQAATLLLAPEAGEAARPLGTLAWLKEGGEAPGAPDEALAASYRETPQKSPVLAGVLSAVLPGAGHLYVDRPRDAAATALVNGLFLWGFFEASRRDEHALAAVLGVFEALWYTGGITGSVNAAHKWNERERDRWFGGQESSALPGFSLLLPPGGGAGAALSFHWR